MENIVKGEVFIIPTKPVSRFRCRDEYGKTWFRDILSQWGMMNKSSEFRAKLILIGVSGDGCNNWYYHGKEFNGKKFPGYIPLKMIKNLREGKSIEVEYNGVKIELTAAQLKHGLSEDKFEKVLKKLLSNK